MKKVVKQYHWMTPQFTVTQWSKKKLHSIALRMYFIRKLQFSLNCTAPGKCVSNFIVACGQCWIFCVMKMKPVQNISTLKTDTQVGPDHSDPSPTPVPRNKLCRVEGGLNTISNNTKCQTIFDWNDTLQKQLPDPFYRQSAVLCAGTGNHNSNPGVGSHCWVVGQAWISRAWKRSLMIEMFIFFLFFS